MKSLRDYITEAEAWVDTPAQGDVLAINIREECLIETHIVDVRPDGVVVHADEKMMSLLESYGYAAEEIRRYGPVGTGSGTGYTGVAETCGSESNYEPEDAFQRVMELAGLGTPNAAHNDPLAAKAADLAPVGTEQDPTTATTMDEAEYQGRKVQLGKPTRGDVKKFKVYVRDPSTGNVKKVNFGDPDMKIKKSIPARRRSFRARHNCDNPGPRTKARYWSCRAW
jgi:hypothetical protein